MATKKNSGILVPIGLVGGAALLGVGYLIYNKLKGNSDIATADVVDNKLLSSNVSYGGGGGGGVTTSSITAQNQTLNAVLSGTNGTAIALLALQLNNCTENPNRTVTSIGAGITLKKNNIILAINDTFIASDVLTFDVANSVTYTAAKEVFKYKASGSCGESNVATISATVNVQTNGVYSPFTIQDAYLNGSTYQGYASLVDAMGKNFDNSGFTNRNVTIYATAMNTGQIAYSNAAGTILYPQGNYFYGNNFEYLSINAQGVMTLFSDVSKDGINQLDIKDSSQ